MATSRASQYNYVNDKIKNIVDEIPNSPVSSSVPFKEETLPDMRYLEAEQLLSQTERSRTTPGMSNRPLLDRLRKTRVNPESKKIAPSEFVVENVPVPTDFTELVVPQLAKAWFPKLSQGPLNKLGWRNNAAAVEVELISSRLGVKPSTLTSSTDNRPGTAIWEGTDKYDKVVVSDNMELDFFPHIHYQIVTLSLQVKISDELIIPLLDVFHSIRYLNNKLWASAGAWEDVVIILVAAKAFLEGALSVLQASRLIYILSDAMGCDRGEVLTILENYIFM